MKPEVLIITFSLFKRIKYGILLVIFIFIILPWKRTIISSMLKFPFDILAPSKSTPNGVTPQVLFQRIKDKKRILLWTTYYNFKNLQDYMLGDVGSYSQSVICSYNCEFTRDRKLLNQSDAVVFHGRALVENQNHSDEIIYVPSDLPRTRLASQYWIFYLWESPSHTTPLDGCGNLFNTTITYRRDSDIYIPNGRVIQLSPDEDPPVIDDFISTKTQLVAWMTMNCNSTSKRETLVAELQEYVEVDVYGGCGNFICLTDAFETDHLLEWNKIHKNPCFDEIGRKYKFFLALENSLCTDYITEKPFSALASGMVPIVYGGVNYSLYLPKGSYINVESFPSMKHLADYLKFLDDNPEEYLKYFEWRQNFKVDDVPFIARAWCALCEKLVTETLPRKEAIQDLKKWWNGDNEDSCWNT